MNDAKEPQLLVAIAQIAPVWLDRAATLSKIEQQVLEAGRSGVQLLALGEALLPGYPFWLEHTDAARFESKLQKRLFAHYVEQSVDIHGGDLAVLQRACRQAGCWTVLGCIERDRRRGHSVFCSQVMIDSEGEIRNVHRKLVPTYEERLAWTPGDGAGLQTFALKDFRLGGLNCWENWMPLARAALYAQGEDLHIASWPGSLRNTELITPFAAREGRSYVLAASALMRREDIPDHLPEAELLRERLPAVCANGGSCIAAPDGSWLVEPCVGREALLMAELDPARVREERQNFDPFGHYSRPDVLQLQLRRDRPTGLLRLDAELPSDQ